MKTDKVRFILYLIMLSCFMAWLATLVLVVPTLMADPKAVDVLMAFGMGTVTGFFILVLKDGWQFYFRKKGTTPPE